MYLLYASRHFEEALEWAKTSAKNNNPHGQYLLAQYCRYGTPPDFETAHLLYRKAAAQGLPEAHWQLGLQYRFGQGTKVDTAQAVNHLRAAAQQGYIPAYTPLAELILPRLPMKPFTGSNRRHRKMTPMPMPHWPTSTYKASIWKETTNMPCIMPKQPQPNAIPKVCGYWATSTATDWA